MNKKIGVLIFPAGEVNAVELHHSLATCVNIRLYGASSVNKHGAYIFKNYTGGLPLIHEADFLEKFNCLLTEKQIDVVFPTHDTVAQFFANYRQDIKAKVIVADTYTADVCRDKGLTYALFEEEDFCPQVYKSVEEKSLPLFIKPKEGQGGVGARLIRTMEDLPSNIDLGKYSITEYLPGEEYTVDCFTDKNAVLRVVLPRVRKRVLAGISVAAEDIPLYKEIQHIAERINEKLDFRGLWWFQLKRDGEANLKLLEVSTRCAGTMCLARARGINLPLLSIYDALGYDTDMLLNPYHISVDRTLISRYKIDYEYDTVYFDFDDTLVIEGKVHLPAISFLYQCKNEGKKLILITKHETDIYADLKSYHIADTIFDEIYHLDKSENKADYVQPGRAIFIDNAYAERKTVAACHGIPVFDVDAIEVLQDWRL